MLRGEGRSFSAGLDRIGFAAAAIIAGEANTAIAHATSGPLLQQNMVVALSGDDTAKGEH